MPSVVFRLARRLRAYGTKELPVDLKVELSGAKKATRQSAGRGPKSPQPPRADQIDGFSSLGPAPERPALHIGVAGTESLPIVKQDTHLEPGRVYLDLGRIGSAPFRALPGQVAGSGNQFVAEHEIPADLWRRLVEAMQRAHEAIVSAEAEGKSCNVRIAVVPAKRHRQRRSEASQPQEARATAK
jgi:hypothetical protein